MRAIIKKIQTILTLMKHKKTWRNENLHNNTTAISTFPINKVKVGKHTYGPLDIKFFGAPGEFLDIGNYCSIAANVKFLMGGEHGYKSLSTFPFKTYLTNQTVVEAITKGPIIIKDDVWIGHSAIVLSGVTIGQGSIIGAGSVVARDVPPYSIYVQGKVIKKRFNDEVIQKLLKFDYENLKDQDIRDNLSHLYDKLDTNFFSSEFYLNNTKY